MTLYVIPDLVWEKCNNFAERADGLCGPFAIILGLGVYHAYFNGAFTIGEFATLELAQSAANDWYKAKMAEGLKVATVEDESKTLDAVRKAILKYYAALDRRKHGGDAADEAFEEIQDAMGMQWEQGATLKKQSTETQPRR